MHTQRNQRGFRPGTSLVEVALCLLVFMIMALGATYYRYLAAANIQKSQRQLVVADLAVTALETWQGAGGSELFDPPATLSGDIQITSAEGDEAPSGSTLLGGYDIDLGGYTYHLTLYWRDIEAGLRELGAAASWLIGSGEERKTYLLTNYVRR